MSASLRFNFWFVENQVYFAFAHPWTYADHLAWISRIPCTPGLDKIISENLESVVLRQMFVECEVLVLTPAGRKVHCITITNVSPATQVLHVSRPGVLNNSKLFHSTLGSGKDPVVFSQFYLCLYPADGLFADRNMDRFDHIIPESRIPIQSVSASSCLFQLVWI